MWFSNISASDILTPRHFDTPFLTPRHFDNKIFFHPDIVPSRYCSTAYKSRHIDTQTFCDRDILPLQSFWHQNILQPKLYTTPPSILTLLTWVQHMQAWPLANSACRLVFGQTESYSVQPCLPLAATIGPASQLRVIFYWVWPASLMEGPDYTAPSCPTASVSYSTIDPNSCDLGAAHSSLAFGQLCTYAGLYPNQILQYAALLAAGGYDWPCGPIKSLFLLNLACILNGRAWFYSSELS